MLSEQTVSFIIVNKDEGKNCKSQTREIKSEIKMRNQVTKNNYFRSNIHPNKSMSISFKNYLQKRVLRNLLRLQR